MQQAQQMRQLFGGNAPGMGGLAGLGGLGGLGGAGVLGGAGDPWGAGALGGAPGAQPGQTGNEQAQQRGPTNLFNPSPAQGAGGAPGAGGMPDFAQLQQLLGGMGGAGAMGGLPGFAGLPGFGGAAGAGSEQPQQQDTRPPEERYATQLQQLREMGFTSDAYNLRALQACGGNVQAAIEYILNSPGY